MRVASAFLAVLLAAAPAPSTPAEGNAADVLFGDDFLDDRNGWALRPGDEVVRTFLEQGAYWMEVKTEGCVR